MSLIESSKRIGKLVLSRISYSWKGAIVNTIKQKRFGRTNHMSTRTIFGGVSLKAATQNEADRMLDLILAYGINHIDTAPVYGDSELRIGPWMKHHRDRFFLATKTDQVSYTGAKEQFHRSLDRLQTDRVDLLQIHNMTDVVRRENILTEGGAIEYLLEAKAEGLTRHIGITGHGVAAPRMHLESLQRYDFDTVLLPFNYLLMKQATYANAFNELLMYCKEKDIPVQTIKATARRVWGDKTRTHATWYEPLTDPIAIEKSVHWVLGNPDVFLNTVGDMQEFPKVLEAATKFENRPSDSEMDQVVGKMQMEVIFNYKTVS
jgi:aryl-alcohol dehydrogenase-like predicted oxidoreductase